MVILSLFLVVVCLLWIARLSGRVNDLEKQRTAAPIPVQVAPSGVMQPMLRHEEAIPKPRAEKRADEEIATGWLTKIGVVAILFGIGFFLKYAIDQGWISELTRVMMGVATGLLLVVLGEIWQSKYRSYALSLSGGGIGILYFSITAAYQFYDLVSRGPAFVLMVLITLGASGLAYRYRSLPLAVLASIGGYASPLLLHSNTDQQIQMFFYITLLNIGVLLVLIKKYWFELLYLSFIGTALNFIVWAGQFSNRNNTLESIVFLLANFAIFWAVTVLLIRLHDSQEQVHEDTDNNQAIFQLLTAIYFSIAIAVLLYGRFHDRLALVSLIKGGIALATYALVSHYGWRLMRYVSSLGIFFFLTLCFIWQFNGAALDISIFFMAAAGIAAGQMLAKEELRFWGFAALVLGLLKTFANQYEMQAYAFLLNEKFALSALYIAGIWAASRFWNGEDQKIKAAAALSLWFAVSWELVAYFGQFPGAKNSLNLSLSVWWIVYALIVLIYGVVSRAAFFRKLAIMLFALSIIKVFVYDVQSLDTGYRVVSFITLGVILLSVSYAYHRHKEKITNFLEGKNQ